MGITPAGISQKPEIEEGDGHYHACFQALNRGRGQGFGGPLALTIQDVYAYTLLIGENRADERIRLLRLLQDMDYVYLEHAAKKAEAIK